MAMVEQPGGARGQDVDLNLAPILDAFVVLITFLLASASFLSIGILDAGISAPGEKLTKKVKPPPVNITLRLMSNSQMKIKVQGRVNRTTSVKRNKDGFDHVALQGRLQRLRKRWPTVDALTITADNSVEYANIVKVMSHTRKIYPAVLLGGF